MLKTKKELIIENIMHMNISMLDVLLDDDKTYQDASKELFLSRLSDVFEYFKKYGDTSLNPYQGVCNSEICSNKGCRGYSFIGNISKKHLDLICIEEGDEIKDMYSCSSFKTDKDVDKGRWTEVDIRHDEEVKFVPESDYYSKKDRCIEALNDLKQYEGLLISETFKS
jgi:hypothetical protein